MPDFLPVPWIQWKRFRVSGLVRELESGAPLPGLHVQAFDKDVVSDDYLGDSETDADGRFDIRFSDAEFKDFLESKPDIYLCVRAPGRSAPLADTSAEVREGAGRDEYFEISIPRAALEALDQPA